jgi:pseudouridine synthase
VNGEVVTRLGTRVDPQHDRVSVDGREVQPASARVYLLLNKPRGYVCTRSDERGRATVLDLLPEGAPPVYPVGRLDMDTEGLLLLTNDGDLAYRLTHPKFEVEKEYVALVRGVPSADSLRRLSEGVEVDGRLTAPAEVRVESTTRCGTVLRLRIHEGRKRQVRRMLAAIGHPVLRLQRVRVGPIALGELAPGETRVLTRAEVESLRRAAEAEGRP